MGEKGMESPAPARSGVAGAAETVGRVTGVTDMAGNVAAGSNIGVAPQGGLAGLREGMANQGVASTNTGIGQPPKS